jgi:hypothetical protein
VSVDGAEEDGVDNRAGAPTWAPDGGSDGAAAGREADQSPVWPSDSADGNGSLSDSSARPSVSQGATGDGSDPADRATSSGAAGSDGNGSDSAAAPLNSGATQASSALAAAAGQDGGPPLPAALSVGSAGATRALAARVTAPFAALTRPRPRPAAPAKKKKPAPRPTGSGLPPPAARPQARLTAGPATGPQTRRAQLRLDRIEPWSVMKFSFLMSLVGWVILFVAVSVLYFALSKLGVFTSIEHTVTLVTGNKSNPAGSNPSNWFKASRVLGYTMLVGAVNVILLTALATVGAVLYNLVTMLAGGIEVTLKESD